MSTTAVKTTKDKIKDLFLTGQTLTSCGAAKDFLTADLRRIITTLKKEGLDITDKWVTSKEGKRYKEYWLKREDEVEPKKEEVPAPVPEPTPAPVCEQITDSTSPICNGPSGMELDLLKRAQDESIRGKQQKLF